MNSLYSGDAKTIKNKGKEEETDGSFGGLLKGKAQFLMQLRYSLRGIDNCLVVWYKAQNGPFDHSFGNKFRKKVFNFKPFLCSK